MFIDAQGMPLLVECKMSDSPDWRGRICSQIENYIKQLIKSPFASINLRAYLGNWSKRYGERWGDYERQIFAKDLDLDEFWQRVDENIKSGLLKTAIVYEGSPKGLEKVRRVLQCSTFITQISFVQAGKFQQQDFGVPHYRFSSERSPTLDEAEQFWVPWPTLRIATRSLVKQQRRVTLVNPPEFLWVDDTKIWCRNYKPEEQHAIDPARTASFIPVMPNLTLLRTTGSPYPNEDKDITVEPFPNESWRPWLKFARSVWRCYSEKGVFSSSSDGPNAIDEALRSSPLLRSDARSKLFGERAIVGSMRDLSLFGLGSLFRHPTHGWQIHRVTDV